IAVGSSIQISLLDTPFLVIVSWALGSDMSFHFETFQTVVFLVSVIVVTCTVQDGKSNYLEGAMLLGLYAIIALAFLVIPVASLAESCRLRKTPLSPTRPSLTRHDVGGRLALKVKANAHIGYMIVIGQKPSSSQVIPVAGVLREASRRVVVKQAHLSIS
ncbi:hypothetical protein CDV31_016972, partial [Fusarium ambrosium]